MPELEHLMTFQAEVKPGLEVGPGPAGTRRIFTVTGGSFEGPRLRGQVLPGGADWFLVGNDGVGRIDVRLTLETHDGALLYLRYPGVLVLNEKMLAIFAEGGESRYGDTYFMTQPRFETGDPRYAWLNSLVAVAEGRVAPGAVEYRVYRVASTAVS